MYLVSKVARRATNRFNEAPAKRGGNAGLVFSYDVGVLLASMRPPRNAGEMMEYYANGIPDQTEASMRPPRNAGEMAASAERRQA